MYIIWFFVSFVLGDKNMPNVVSYAEKNYLQKKNLYDSIAQVFSDWKNETANSYGWNKPVQEMNGCTMRFLAEGHLEITYHRFEVCTVEGLARGDNNGPKFLKDVVKELKKSFRKKTGKALKLEKVREDQAIEKYSRIQADTSWMLGSSRYGYGARPVGRYLVRDSCVYEFDIETLK